MRKHECYELNKIIMQNKHKFNESECIKKCNELGLNYIGFHKEKKKGTMVEFTCNKHLDKGIQYADWSHFRNASVGCPYCIGRYKTTDDIIKEVEGRGIKILSEYNGWNKPITCQCLKCGNIWTTQCGNITNGRGCPKCGRKIVEDSRRKTQEEFVEELALANPDIEALEKIHGVHNKIKCRCKICGTVWDAYPSNLLNRTAGCVYCNISIGEQKMLDTLDELGIDYIPQYTVSYYSKKNPMRIDAYNEEFKVAFEYNGEQHYRPVDFAGNGEEWAQKTFQLGRERDAKKKRYCDENGISMIIIPYYEQDNMKEYIINAWEGLNLSLVS